MKWMRGARIGDELIWKGDAWARPPFDQPRVLIVVEVDDRGYPMRAAYEGCALDPRCRPGMFARPPGPVPPDHDPGDEDSAR